MRSSPYLKPTALVLLAALLWLGTACTQAAVLPTPLPTAISQATLPASIAAQPAAPSPTPLPPTATVFPTATPVPTETPLPSPTPTPTHPLMIEMMRQVDYPGSELVFEETLEPGDNYARYIVSYQSEGNKIFALMTVPWGPKPESGWPIIIFNHGYIPPDEYRTTERYVDYVDGFARNGYIVFRSDYRGHGSSEGEARGGYSQPDYTADVLNGMASVQRYADADPQRVGMWGHSMGGQITLRAMVVSDQIKAGVIWAGVVASYPDILANWRSRDDEDAGPTPTPDPTRVARRANSVFGRYGTPEENPAFWAAISPNTYVADLSGPLQLHHATGDDVVPIIFSELLNAEVQAVGLPIDFFVYQGDNHNISANFWTAMAESVAFFDQHVKNVGGTP